MIPKGPYMDMHTHILPGIDDGSQTIEQTANMLRTAYDEGRRIALRELDRIREFINK